MAIFKNGILGPFRGKLGTVIGAMWNGRWTMRSLPASVSNPRTEAQQAHRAKFGLVGGFAKAMNPIVRYGMWNTATAGRITPFNVCVGVNMTNGCVQGTGTEVSLDYTKVSISQGEGVAPESPNASMGESQVLTVTWSDNSGISPEVLSHDMICVAAYNGSRNKMVYDVSSATRGDEELMMSCPALWTGEEVQVFLFSRSADGSAVSETVFVGTVTVS